MTKSLPDLIAELETAQTAMNDAADAKHTAGFVYGGDRTQIALAENRAKEAVRELQRCKDNLCAFILENKEQFGQ